MTDVKRRNITAEVKVLDSFILYKSVQGALKGLREGDLVELEVQLTLERRTALYSVNSISEDKQGRIANLLLIKLLD